jgi:predicted amino acid racemase
MVSAVAQRRGLGKVVAVDIHGAKMAHRYRIPIGHIGHLNQIPRYDVPRALAMRPEVITVYSVQSARWISEAAGAMGITQDLLLRVYAPGDVFFEGQEGGFREAEVMDAAREILGLPHVRIVGTTSFPVLYYNFEDSREPVRPNPNFATITRVAGRLRDELGIEIRQVNAPGNTAIATFPLLKEHGATHVEPGHGLLGTTPYQINQADSVEKPVYAYVSEVSHHWEGRAYAFGGGIWSLLGQFMDKRWPITALVGSDPDSAKENPLDYEHRNQIIDYHVSLLPGERARIGDTVVLGLYTQSQMTRSHIAPVSGIQRGEPRVRGLFDHATHMLDDDYEPIPLETARHLVQDVAAEY